MPITSDNSKIKVYVPKKHLLASNFEANNEGFYILKDNFDSIFPSIMRFPRMIFGKTETVLEFRWAYYKIIEGERYLVISSSSTFDSLISELDKYNISYKNAIPAWYISKINSVDKDIQSAVFSFRKEKNLAMYLRSKTEYGYIVGETKEKKEWLFGSNKISSLKTTLKTKLPLTTIGMIGDIDFSFQNTIKEINQFIENL